MCEVAPRRRKTADSPARVPFPPQAPDQQRGNDPCTPPRVPWTAVSSCPVPPGACSQSRGKAAPSEGSEPRASAAVSEGPLAPSSSPWLLWLDEAEPATNEARKPPITYSGAQRSRQGQYQLHRIGGHRLIHHQASQSLAQRSSSSSGARPSRMPNPTKIDKRGDSGSNHSQCPFPSTTFGRRLVSPCTHSVPLASAGSLLHRPCTPPALSSFFF